jgi:hypothetical protein
MSRNRPAQRLARLGAVLVLAAGLAACGKVGRLERPAPMFGHKPAPDTAHAPPGRNPDIPIDTVDPRDRSVETPPAPTLPGSAARPESSE